MLNKVHSKTSMSKKMLEDSPYNQRFNIPVKYDTCKKYGSMKVLGNAISNFSIERQNDLLTTVAKLNKDLRQPIIPHNTPTDQSVAMSYQNSHYGSLHEDNDDSSMSIMSMSSMGFSESKYGVAQHKPVRLTKKLIHNTFVRIGKAIDESGRRGEASGVRTLHNRIFIKVQIYV